MTILYFQIIAVKILHSNYVAHISSVLNWIYFMKLKLQRENSSNLAKFSIRAVSKTGNSSTAIQGETLKFKTSSSSISNLSYMHSEWNLVLFFVTNKLKKKKKEKEKHARITFDYYVISRTLFAEKKKPQSKQKNQ